MRLACLVAGFFLVISCEAYAQDKQAEEATPEQPTIAEDFSSLAKDMDKLSPEQRAETIAELEKIHEEMQALPEEERRAYFDEAKQRVKNIDYEKYDNREIAEDGISQEQINQMMQEAYKNYQSK